MGLPFPVITTVLKKKPNSKSSFSWFRGRQTTPWKQNVRCTGNRHPIFRFQVHWFMGHIYWWSTYFTDFPIWKGSCSFVSLLGRSTRKPSLHRVQSWLFLQVSAQLSPTLRGLPWLVLYPFTNRINHTLSVLSKHFFWTPETNTTLLINYAPI